MIRRRDVLTLLSGAAAWPVAARAQQVARVRRVGVLINQGATDPDAQDRIAAFVQGLGELGWTVGRNIRIEYRWADGDAQHIRTYAAELVVSAPDVLLGTGGFGMTALREATRTIPTVFVTTTDPVGQGFVGSLARPGGNATGFMVLEYGASGKWLELLKEIAPAIKRAAVVRELATAGGSGQFGAIQAGAPSLGVELTSIDVNDANEAERAITAFASKPAGGLIVPASAPATVIRHMLIRLAAQYRLPSVFFARRFSADGGLISYGADLIDQYRRAAAYVDRILKGEKPADLPVQAPTKYELVVNLKTARALGLTVPPALLARADEVIE